jgi:hypothetical protein
MRYFKPFTGVVLAAMALFIVNGCDSDDNSSPMSSSPAPTTKIRVIHTSYDAPAVDVAVDGSVAVASLAYGQSSGYAEIPSGTRNIKVTPAGLTQPVVIGADISFEASKEYTVFAINKLDNIEAVISEDMRTANPSKAKVRFVHASPDAPSVDIKLLTGTGPAVFSARAFGTVSNYIEVDGGNYSFAVTAAGMTDEVVVLDPVSLENGKVYSIIARGSLSDTNYPFSVQVFIDNDLGKNSAALTFADRSDIMVVHASPDAPGVDLLINNITLNAAPLTFPNSTGYITLADGNTNIKVSASGGGPDVIDANLNLGANQAYSVFAVDTLASISPLVLADDLTTPVAGKAHVRFVHLSPNAPAVDITLTNGAVVFGNKAFKEYTNFTPLDAGTYDLQVRVSGTSTVALDLPGVNFMDGKIYTVFAKGLLGGMGSQALGASIIVNN